MFYRLLILFYALVLRTEPPVGGFDPPQLLRFAWSHENGSFLAQQPYSLSCGPVQDVSSAF